MGILNIIDSAWQDPVGSILLLKIKLQRYSIPASLQFYNKEIIHFSQAKALAPKIAASASFNWETIISVFPS